MDANRQGGRTRRAPPRTPLLFRSRRAKSLDCCGCVLREREMNDGAWWRRSTKDDGLRGMAEGGGDAVEVGRLDDRCSVKRVVKSRCTTDEVEPGNFVRKCEKTEQLLRQCVGRPVEVVESNTEYSEEDVTHEMRTGSSTYRSSDVEPFSFPGLRGDIEFLERGLLGGFSRFLEAAEDMRNEFFQALGGHLSDGETRSRSTRAADGGFDEEVVSSGLPRSKGNQSAYSEYAAKISDV